MSLIRAETERRDIVSFSKVTTKSKSMRHLKKIDNVKSNAKRIGLKGALLFTLLFS